MKSGIFISAILLAVTLPLSCFVKYTVFNNTGFPDTDTSYPKSAVLEERGYRFWIDGGDGVASDRLILNPGTYMIRFRHSYSRSSGAVYCALEAGKVYGLEISDRQYLPRSGVYADLGICFEKEVKESE
jgi:hypothetical protein